MTKEEVEKKIIKKKVMSKSDIEQALIDNFINLQKVLTNLSVKFDEMSSKISKMLELFEISAKTFAEKYAGETSPAGIDADFLKKLDSLLDQNKTISKGIMLMEERIKDRAQTNPQNTYREPIRPRPLPRY